MQALCRSQFTRGDLAFVIDRLAAAGDGTGRGALERLCGDEHSLDQILDLVELHRALVDEPSCLEVSPAFYFYVLTRRELLRRGLDDRNLCDYIASVLAEFTHRQKLETKGATPSTRTFAYVSDLMLTIDKAPAPQVYGLRRFLADYILFLSGVFKENIEARQNRGAPGLPFYEALGQQSYRSVAAHPQARREELGTLFEQIAEAFHEVRLALNQLTERAFHLEAPSSILISSVPESKS